MIEGTHIAPRVGRLQAYAEEQVRRLNEREKTGRRLPVAVKRADGICLIYRALTSKNKGP